MRTSHDAIIIGTGAAGGIVAGVLAEAGKNVLLLERGPALSFSQIGRDHLRNQRLSIYGHNAGPELEGNPRVFVDPAGNERTVQPHEPDYHNNAACVGGGTRVYGAQAWRFMPADFRISLTNAPGDNAYPIASFTWLLVYRDQPDETKGKALVKFLWWMIHDGQKYTSDLLYAPLPPQVVKQVEARLGEITYQGKPLLAAR